MIGNGKESDSFEAEDDLALHAELHFPSTEHQLQNAFELSLRCVRGRVIAGTLTLQVRQQLRDRDLRPHRQPTLQLTLQTRQLVLLLRGGQTCSRMI